MERLRSLDRFLLLTLVPLWVLGLALSLSSFLRHPGYSSVFVEASPEPGGPPVLASFRRWLEPEASGLEVGDRLLRVGERDLAGQGPFGFFLAVAEQQVPERRVSLEYERGGERRRTELPVGSYAMYGAYLPPALAFGVAGVILLLRARPSPMVSAFFQAFLCIGLVFASYVAGSRALTTGATVVNLAAWTLVFPLTLRAALHFPEEHTRPGVWASRAPWLFLPVGLLVPSSRFGVPLAPDLSESGVFVAMAIFFVALLAVMTARYRDADAIGRRRLRWAMLGFYAAAIPPLVGSVLASVDSSFTPLANLCLAATALFPLSLVVAVSRFNLFDVDRLISATASYNLGMVAAVGLGLILVPRVGEMLSAGLGLAPAAGQLLLAFGIAALVPLGQRWLRPLVDRVIFAERYEVDRGIQQLLGDLSRCGGPQELLQLTGVRVNSLLRPESCVLYARDEGSYTPVFVEGRAVPPGFEDEGPLVAALAQRREPLALHDAGRRHPAPDLGPFDEAALATLAAEIVLPIRRGKQLLAFLCLGTKRSGDVYTATDHALMVAVADKVSLQLLLFDDEEVIREGQAMRDELRRYVPGAVVDVLESGEEPEAGEREVSVLFIDIRGYTGIAEQRRAEEIFATLSRYTELVSKIVREHGGSVVEFSGDGLMAVFGAPRELPGKERAAAEVGISCIAAVGKLRGPGEGGAPLEVGVGIATGMAYVGNIRAVDRVIWSAIGNTTNLAARLQALTRSLDTALVIDEETWSRVGDLAGRFRRHRDTRIRGRRQTVDVHSYAVREAPPRGELVLLQG